VNPLGLFDLDRKIRPVGHAYRTLIEQWRPVIPNELRFPFLAFQNEATPPTASVGDASREQRATPSGSVQGS
jgi:hypothetical protein